MDILLILLLVLGTAQKVRSPIKVAPRPPTADEYRFCRKSFTLFCYCSLQPFLVLLFNLYFNFYSQYYSSNSAAHQSESEALVYTNIWNEEKAGSSGLFFLLNNCDSKRLNVHLG